MSAGNKEIFAQKGAKKNGVVLLLLIKFTDFKTKKKEPIWFFMEPSGSTAPSFPPSFFSTAAATREGETGECVATWSDSRRRKLYSSYTVVAVAFFYYYPNLL